MRDRALDLTRKIKVDPIFFYKLMDCSSLAMHEMHEYNVQIQLHHHGHVTFCKMLSLQRGAEKLGAGALTKLYQEEEQKAK